jgi:hypothetical protein
MVNAGDGLQWNREEKEAERKGAGRRRDAEMKGRCGVCCWQERKGSRSLRRIPLCKRPLPSRARGDRGEAERLSTPGPLLSHPMTGGLGPASQRRDRWRKGGKAESEPPRPLDGLE